MVQLLIADFGIRIAEGKQRNNVRYAMWDKGKDVFSQMKQSNEVWSCMLGGVFIIMHRVGPW